MQPRNQLDEARARLAYQAGDLETAENAFSASLAEVTSRAALNGLACVYRAQGREDLELKTLQQLADCVLNHDKFKVETHSAD